MNTHNDFVTTMERLFGSDEALGVYFEIDETGKKISFQEYEIMYKELGDKMPDTSSFLPTGGSGVCCTDFAVLIWLELHGRVKIYGFPNENNPTSRFVREKMHPGGHDFAVVDDRYIVDPWPRLVQGAFDQMVFDMQDEQELVTATYGPAECWTRMHVTEEYATRELLKAA